jgi:hypothetical protein
MREVHDDRNEAELSDGTPRAGAGQRDAALAQPDERIADVRIGGGQSSALQRQAEIICDASNDSFPASDPPSWGAMRVGPPRP